MDATTRFTDRVDNYIKYRPGYPAAVFEALVADGYLAPQSAVADLGSGTGILSAEFLARGHTVYGVEPNDAMRLAAESLLHDQARFVSINATAEATTLDAGSIDLAVAGQASHWFDGPKVRAECQRILCPQGAVALLWNDRETDTSPFLVEYERLLIEKGTDYSSVDHKNVTDEQLRAFFGLHGFDAKQFPNEQRFDWEGLYGRAMSASYVPAAGDPRHGAFVDGLRALYEAHAEASHVTVTYQTRMFVGRIS